MAEENKGAEMKKLFVTGKTFEVKDALKAVGFKWDRPTKRWWREVSADELDQAKTAVEGLGVTVHVEGDADAPPVPAEKGDGGAKPAAKKKFAAPSGPRLTVGGKTYPLKTEIKELGFRWDRDTKQWWRNADKKEAMEIRRDLERLSPEISVNYIEEEAPGDGGDAAGD